MRRLWDWACSDTDSLLAGYVFAGTILGGTLVGIVVIVAALTALVGAL
jgi:hypothetical protein